MIDPRARVETESLLVRMPRIKVDLLEGMNLRHLDCKSDRFKVYCQLSGYEKDLLIYTVLCNYDEIDEDLVKRIASSMQVRVVRVHSILENGIENKTLQQMQDSCSAWEKKLLKEEY